MPFLLCAIAYIAIVCGCAELTRFDPLEKNYQQQTDEKGVEHGR